MLRFNSWSFSFVKELKCWLKDTLENFDSQELKYFHWHLLNADESNDGFKSIKKCRLEHADRLDTVDLMVQIYTSKTREVTEKILQKMDSGKGVWYKKICDTRFDAVFSITLYFFHWPPTEKPLPNIALQDDQNIPTATTGKGLIYPG